MLFIDWLMRRRQCWLSEQFLTVETHAASQVLLRVAYLHRLAPDYSMHQGSIKQGRAVKFM
jgi:hypothetical protein